MQQYKVTKYVKAERMFQSNAEQIIGKIRNLTHGNDGYLIEDEENGVSWQPKSVFEKESAPIEGFKDKLHLMIQEAEQHLQWLEQYHKRETYTARRRIKTYIKDINQLLQNQDV